MDEKPLNEKDTAKRRDAALARALNTPHKPQPKKAKKPKKRHKPNENTVD